MNTDYEKIMAEDIRNQYLPHEETKIEKLQQLDKKACRPAKVFAYVFGIVSTLVLGVGMCLAMKVIGNLMPLGIVIGVVGIAMCIANFYIYRAVLKSGRKKYEKQILALSDELLNK